MLTTKLNRQDKKNTRLATEAMDDVHEPIRMHRVLDALQELAVPHVLGVRFTLEAVEHCSGTIT